MYRRTRSATVSMCLLWLACSGSDVAGPEGPEEPGGPAPSISVTLSAANLALTQGESGTITVTITRNGGFSGAVTLALAGAPQGVTGTFTPASVPSGSTSSALAVSATPSAAPGTHSLTVRATGTGVTAQTSTVSLVVAAAPPAITVETPDDATLVIGEPFSLMLVAGGPGPFTFESTGAELPDGMSLNATTGALSGTPTPAALLSGTPIGEWSGIVIRVTSGGASAETEPFTLKIVGRELPAPYAYMPFDGSELNDAFGRPGVAVGNVDPGRPGAIGEAVFVGGSDTYIRYPTSLSSQLNGKAGFTLAIAIQTTSNDEMFFNLSDRSTHYSRVYAALAGGRIQLGGRSLNRSAEPFRSVIGGAFVNNGEFRSVVGVIDLPADRVSIFIDGILDIAGVIPFAGTTYESFDPADQNVLGHISTVADAFQAPSVTHDELALWDGVLDADEAATIGWLLRTGTSLREWIGF